MPKLEWVLRMTPPDRRSPGRLACWPVWDPRWRLQPVLRAMMQQAAQFGLATNLQMLFEIFRVDGAERDAVEAELRAIYRELGA